MPKTATQLVDEVIAREGGYNNHPVDRGGLELPPSEWSIDYDSLDRGEPHPVSGPVFMRKPALFSSGQACLP
ncbi:hypothetical protein GCM10009095_03270 [Sphingomonas molluscorum]|nr:hypothetical protein GCM10017606_13710 [Microbacterium terregens]